MGEILIEEVYHITGVGVVIVARIIDDMINVGDEVIIGNKITRVKAIEKHHKRWQNAMPNEIVGLQLTDISKNEVKRGMRCHFRHPGFHRNF